MAQHYIDNFSEYSGRLSLRYQAPPTQTVTDGALVTSVTAAQSCGYSFIDTDNDPSANNIELFLVTKISALGTAVWIPGLRCSGTYSAKNGYFLRVTATGIRINRYDAGAASTLSDDLGTSLSANTKYCIRFSAKGSTISAKIWLYGTPESTALATTSATDSTYPSGWSGLAWITGTNVSFTTYFLGAGTGDDAAPTGPVYPKSSSKALYVSQRLLREPRLLVPGMQPVGNVKVDWSNPITRKLIFCFYPPHYVNLADNGAAVITNASPVVAANTGLQWAGHAGTTRVDWPSKTRVTGTDFSWFSRGNYYNGAAFAEEIVFANFNMFGNAFYSYVNWTAGKANLSARYNVIASGSAIPNETISVGETLLSGVTNGCKAWFNGKISNTLTYTISALSTNAYTTSFGFYPSSSWLNRHPAGMNTEVCYAWDRALNDSEMVALHADPYQFLIPA